MSSHFIIVAGIFCQNSSKVLGVDHDQMISALAPDRPDQTFNVSVLPRCAQRRRPVSDPHLGREL
jgi:hypothetical protein